MCLEGGTTARFMACRTKRRGLGPGEARRISTPPAHRPAFPHPCLPAYSSFPPPPQVGLNGNRAYKVEMANVYRVHALALIAQVGWGGGWTCVY